MGGVLVPFRFYGYDALIYLISAVIGLLISYRAYRLHKMSGERVHFYLYMAFAVLSVGLATLSLTSGYAYAKYFVHGEDVLFDELFDVADMGRWIYFFASLLSYGLFVLMYLPKSERDKFLIALPIGFSYLAYMHVVLFFLIGYVTLRAAFNFVSKKSLSSMLVAGGFLLISMYHASMPFTTFHRYVYVFSHVCLVSGFLCLLVMLIKVGKGND